MRTRIILLAAAFAAACTTQNNSALVITKVVPPKTDTSTTTPPVTTCSFDPADKEFTLLPVNLTSNQGGNVGAVVENLIPPTNSDNSLNLDASMFLPHQAVVRYEFPGNPNGAPPAGVTVTSPVVIPVSGQEVPGGGSSATVGIPMFLPGVITGTPPEQSFIRVTFHIEGKLLGGANARTSEREYLFQVCSDPANPACAANACF